jgi:hypothetical protein
MSLTQVPASMQEPNAQYTGFKNRIINGAMMIDQRNAGASVTNSTGIIYTLDRWAVQTVSANCSIQQVAGSTGNNKALRITGTTGNTNTLLSQKIEANNIADLAGQTITVSFTLYGSASGSVSVRFLYPTATDNYTSTTEPVSGTSVSFTSTATTYTVTRTLDANANKGLWVVIERGATGSGVTWSVENFQLEKGSTATSFDYRPYGTELALCQRYYTNGDHYTVLPAGAAGQLRRAEVRFPVSMRAAPTVTFNDNVTSGNVYRNSSVTASIFNTSSLAFRLQTSSGGASTGDDLFFNWFSNAEL